MQRVRAVVGLFSARVHALHGNAAPLFQVGRVVRTHRQACEILGKAIPSLQSLPFDEAGGVRDRRRWHCVSSKRALWMRRVHGVRSAAL